MAPHGQRARGRHSHTTAQSSCPQRQSRFRMAASVRPVPVRRWSPSCAQEHSARSSRTRRARGGAPTKCEFAATSSCGVRAGRNRGQGLGRRCRCTNRIDWPGCCWTGGRSRRMQEASRCRAWASIASAKMVHLKRWTGKLRHAR
eukprot:12477771-Alexandrium_andersonii.AAC.1